MAQVLEARYGFLCGGTMAVWHPPQHEKRLGHSGEPLATPGEYLGMATVIDVAMQRLHRFPDREVHDDAVVGVWADRRGIARFGPEAPDEARGRASAKALISSSAATKPAISGASSGATR